MKLSISNVRFDAERHEYWLGEKQLKGVTPIVGWLYPKTYEGISEATLKRAADHGHMIHEACRLADELGIVSDDEQVQDYLRICKDNILERVANEYLVSDGKDFASSIDVIFRGNDVTLADIKTTSTLHTENVTVQLSIYALFFEMMNPDVKVGKLVALWLPKKMYGQAKVVELRRLSAELCGRIIDTYRESLNTLDLSGEYEQKAQELRALVSSELGITKADDNLPKDFKDAEQEVANIETEMKRLKERSEALKSGLLALMQKYDVKKWDGERVTLTRKLASKRTGVDSKKLQAEYPDVWAACQKTTEVGESLTIKVK